MIVRLMRQIKNVRPWMVAVALASGAAWSSCDSGGGSCEPSALYGPATCTTDDECVAIWGVGATCTPGPAMLDDGCGHQVEWGRICTGGATDADADADVAADADADVDGDVMVHYGPPPTDADADADVPDDMVVAYGPPPVEAGTDVPDDMVVFYGPPLVDATDDTPAVYYGPIPVDAGSDETGITPLYGPTPAF